VRHRSGPGEHVVDHPHRRVPGLTRVGRSPIQPGQLAGVVRAFDADRRLVTVDRLRGGSRKGVYRLGFADRTTVVLYVWAGSENYWPARAEAAGPFADASGLDPFVASHARLDALGVRTPRVYLVDGSRTSFPADLAVVEDVAGGTLETLLHNDVERGRSVVDRLAAQLGTLHAHQSTSFGRLCSPDDGDTTPVVLDRALGHLDEAAARVDRIRAVHRDVRDRLGELAGAVTPRARYGLIHGELGPDHVLVDGAGLPYLIDIECLLFFDIEWEHVFLELRFGPEYHRLRAPDLDEHRLRFYRLAMHLSLVAGPLRLLDGDFPDREPMRAIAEYNIEKTLRLLD